MIVEVMLYGQILGRAEWNAEKGSTTFQYDKKIIRLMEPSPIIMSSEGELLRNLVQAYEKASAFIQTI